MELSRCELCGKGRCPNPKQPWGVYAHQNCIDQATVNRYYIEPLNLPKSIAEAQISGYNPHSYSHDWTATYVWKKECMAFPSLATVDGCMRPVYGCDFDTYRQQEKERAEAEEAARQDREKQWLQDHASELQQLPHWDILQHHPELWLHDQTKKPTKKQRKKVPEETKEKEKTLKMSVIKARFTRLNRRMQQLREACWYKYQQASDQELILALNSFSDGFDCFFLDRMMEVTCQLFPSLPPDSSSSSSASAFSSSSSPHSKLRDWLQSQAPFIAFRDQYLRDKKYLTVPELCEIVKPWLIPLIQSWIDRPKPLLCQCSNKAAMECPFKRCGTCCSGPCSRHKKNHYQLHFSKPTTVITDPSSMPSQTNNNKRKEPSQTSQAPAAAPSSSDSKTESDV
jgi:hypothetical protein